MPERRRLLFFSIIADEVTDKFSNQEILSVCLRFVENATIKEVFLDYVYLERTTGESISNAILKSLLGLDIAKCRGQSYDGASCMSSETSGIQGRIKSVAPRELYTHCKSHALNLTIASSCKHPQICNMMDTVNETFIFFHNSPKRQRFFERVIQSSEIKNNQPLKKN